MVESVPNRAYLYSCVGEAMILRCLIVFSLLLAVTFCQFVASSKPADESVSEKSVIQLAADYERLLRTIEYGSERSSLEPLADFQEKFSGRLSEIERLKDDEFTVFKTRMRGFLINREEVVFAKPDNEFFQKLAARKGLPADIAFFDLRSRLRPDSIWAAYIEQQTDYSGCTLYGTGMLTELYGLLNSFKEKYPTAYVQMVSDELDYIKDALTTGTCACGGLPSAIKEFELFIERYPNAEITPRLRDRKSNTDEKSKIRRFCTSG